MATSPMSTVIVSPCQSEFDMPPYSPTPSEFMPLGSERMLNLISPNSTFRAIGSSRSVSFRDDPRRSLSRQSRDRTTQRSPSALGLSRVSLELSHNVSIELGTSRVEPQPSLEQVHPSKENYRRARLMARLILGLAQAESSKLEHYFHKFDPETIYWKRLITQRSPNVFDVRMLMRNPMPAGYFETVPTYQRNAPGGYVLYRMSKSLTVEDRSLMKDVWGPCLLDDEYLAPSVVHPWISKGVKKAVKQLQGIKVGRSTYGFMVSTKPPEVLVIVRAISEATLVSSVFTLHIYPAVMETGRPRIAGFHLRMPLPPVLPYSRAGMKVMREVEQEVETGKLVWYLEGRHIEGSKSAVCKQGKNRHARCLESHGQLGHGSESRDSGGFGSSRRSSEVRLTGRQKWSGNGSVTSSREGRTWVISMEPLERRLLNLSLKTMPKTGARKGFATLDSIFETSEELWNVLGTPQMTSLKLWTLKRAALRNRNQHDWTKALLRLLFESVNKKFGTYFLQPTVNFLSETDEKSVNNLLRLLRELTCKSPDSAGGRATSGRRSTPQTPTKSPKGTSEGNLKLTPKSRTQTI